MKQKFFAASIVMALALPASAQLSTDSLKKTTMQVGKTELGDQLLTLAGALKPESFKPAYSKEKNEFFKSVKSSKDDQEIAKNITEFVTYIRPEKFRNGFNVEEFKLKIKSGTSIRKSAENLMILEEALKPDAISSMWSLTKAGWKNEMKQLQKSSK